MFLVLNFSDVDREIELTLTKTIKNYCKLFKIIAKKICRSIQDLIKRKKKQISKLGLVRTFHLLNFRLKN